MAGQAKHAHSIRDWPDKTPVFEEFDDQLFQDWTELLENEIGLYIAPERRSFLASGLRMRMRENDLRSYRKYYSRLASTAPEAEEWSLLVDCLKVHETCFFRHSSSMRLVKDVVLSEALKRGVTFSALSVGCATGEEAYSLAMLVDDYCSEKGRKCSFGITGTDISRPALRHARKGRYLIRRLADIDSSYQRKYCRRLSSRYFEIDASLRKRVCFSHLNLRDLAKAPFGELDLIYCHNLMIYFDREKRFDIAEGLAARLRPGGVLILGPGELLHWKNTCMERLRYDDTLAFRRLGSAGVTQHERN